MIAQRVTAARGSFRIPISSMISSSAVLMDAKTSLRVPSRVAFVSVSRSNAPCGTARDVLAGSPLGQAFAPSDFPGARITDQQNFFALCNKTADRELEEQRAIHLFAEGECKRAERATWVVTSDDRSSSSTEASLSTASLAVNASTAAVVPILPRATATSTASRIYG